jgi:transcription antitermination factor NusG
MKQAGATMRQWYLGFSKGGKEFEVSEALCWEGFNVWCGRVRVMKRKGKDPRPREYEEPALPNYLFLNLDEHEWHNVSHKHLRHTMAVLSPLAVRGFMAFKARVENMGIIDRMTPGTEIEITGGAFKDTLAMLRRTVDDGRVVEAELEIFGRKTVARFPIGDISPVS